MSFELGDELTDERAAELTVQAQQSYAQIQAEAQQRVEQYGIGLIATSPTDLRIAFSCLETIEIEPLFEAVHSAIQELQQ